MAEEFKNMIRIILFKYFANFLPTNQIQVLEITIRKQELIGMRLANYLNRNIIKNKKK